MSAANAVLPGTRSVGLDIGGTKTHGVVLGEDGTILAQVRESTRPGADGVVATAARVFEALARESGGSLQCGVGVGVPGLVDSERGMLRHAVNLDVNGDDLPLRDLLAERLGVPVVVENDVNAAALAEQAHGHGRGISDFAFVSIGTGIGLGLVIGGQLHRGAHGAAGEIGFLPQPSGHPGDARDARRRGPLEAAASAAGIVRAARRAGLRGRLTARSVFAAAEGGDRRAGAVVATEAQLIARALCTVVAVADPELVVLGGGVGQADGFLTAVTREVRRMAPVLPELRVSALGTDAVVDGCLAAGLDQAWQIVTARLAAPA